MRSRTIRLTAALAGAATAVTVLAACSSSGSGGSSSGAGDGGKTVDVVASTNVYGDIVKQIGGSAINVQSIISDPDQDPHSYEANSRTQLALAKADLVIENGGGYDDFVDRMLKSAGKAPTTINVVKLSGKSAPAGGDLNEHVWYDFPTVTKLVNQLATDLSAKDRSDAATFHKNATAYNAKITALEKTEASVKAQHHGVGVAITEPVPLYMLQACGLVNKTPAAFSEAIEEGSDVPVGVLNQTLGLFKDKTVQLLAYNEQTSGAETEKVLSAAKANGVAIVPVTETLPKGKNYLSWMTSNLQAVERALS